VVDGGDQDRGGRPLLGYAVSVGIVLAVFIPLIVLLAGQIGDDDGDSSASPGDVSAGLDGGDREGLGGSDDGSGDLLPEGGTFAPPRKGVGMATAAEAAGCELENHPVRDRDHIRLDQDVDYSSAPPTSGPHYYIPAPDSAYQVAPDVKTTVHALEHSRVVIWFKRDLPEKARAALKAFYTRDSDRMLLVPDTTGMDYQVAATAWNAKPGKHGTGRLLGCPEYRDELFTALEAFKDRHRGRGPERIP
jgi:hypothetical protein